MLIAQLSDLHICLKGDLGAKNIFAERAIAALSRLNPRPDIVILTGDVTEFGTAEEYGMVSQMLSRLDMPIYAIPGNHDDREEMRVVFREVDRLAAGRALLNYVIETRPVRLVGLDSTIPGRVEGALTGATLHFLEETLAMEPRVPTLIFLHHPPIMTGLESKDSIRLFEGADRLASILSRHPQVERLVSGHFHRSIQARFGTTICQVAPAVRYMTPAERGDPDEHEFDEELPGFLLHRWIEAVGLVSHICPIPLTNEKPSPQP
jgi:3',5'-cyclic-AMP phosphodiesterase